MGNWIAGVASLVALTVAASACAKTAEMVIENRYARIELDHRGFVVSILARSSGKQYSPQDHPSPLLRLTDGGKTIEPVSAEFTPSKHEVAVKFSNGAVAVVDVQAKDVYFRFQLLSLEPRGTIDNVVWGPLNTTISGKIGDLIGVVRDPDWAIGMLGLDDNTIAGPPSDGDAYGMGYTIHSPDPKLYPVPPQYKEGQWFRVGGNGVSDVAFYSHPEEYFQQVIGSGAKLEPEFGSSVAYHSRDRRRPYTVLYSMLPGFEGSRARHQVTDVVDVDFTGSGIALYACPDDKGLATIEKILLAENLPHIAFDGKWVRDPSFVKPDIAWWGPHDKMIEYANALDLKAVQDEGQGEYYADPSNHWLDPRVGFADGTKKTYKEFTAEAAKYGIKYGLHTLTLFLQPNRCSDVSPEASAHLNVICRTKLAESVSATDTHIVVTNPSLLPEDGTWTNRDGVNYVRIGTELIKYRGITDRAPYTLLNVERGSATTAKPHEAGEEVAKLQMNCYGGFVPDMKAMLDYADLWATVLYENGMQYIDFDGLESTFYQAHGYYAVRVFMRRLFDTFAKLSDGKHIRVMGSAVPAGAWEYMSVCNVGGDDNMFDPVGNRWGIEGKDIRNAFNNSYFPSTFGIQGYHSDWSLYDAENLEAKSIGWGAGYMLGLSQDAVENSGEKDAIFTAFRAWEDARDSGAFDAGVKRSLQDLGLKFHLERRSPSSFRLHPVKEVRCSVAGGQEVDVENAYGSQRAQFALRFNAAAESAEVSVGGGLILACPHRIEAGQLLICKGDKLYLADKNRRKIEDLPVQGAVRFPKGRFSLAVKLAGAGAKADLTVWLLGPGRELRSRYQGMSEPSQQ